MMIQLPSVPEYILESSFCLVFFYAIYLVLLRKETFHQFNKYYLLSTALCSVLLPFMDFNTVEAVQHASGVVDPLLQYRAEAKQFQSSINNSQFYSISVGDVVKAIFYIGIFLTALKFLYSLFQLLEKIKRNNANQEVQESSNKLSAISLFNFLFRHNDVDKEHDGSKLYVVKYDASRLRSWHCIDVIIIELLVVLNWLNPLMYLYRNSFYKANDYVVDEYVAMNNGGRTSYAEQLMHEETKSKRQGYNFNYAIMLDRILMLAKSRTSSLAKLKPLLVIPMAISMMALFSFDYVEKLPDEVKMGIESLENKIVDVSDLVVLNLTHSKRNYEWEFRWGSHLYGLTSKDDNGIVKYDMSKEISLYDLYETIENTPSYKTKGVYESMGFDIKFTSNSDTVSNISVPIGDYEGLGEKMKKAIIKHKTPFNIYFSNIGSANGKKDGGFMITVYQYLSNNKEDEEEQEEVKKIKAHWGDLNLTGSDLGWISSNGNRSVFDRMNYYRFSEEPKEIDKIEFISSINDKFQLLINDEELDSSEGQTFVLALSKSEFVKTNVSWNPEAKSYIPNEGSRSVSRSMSSVYHGRNFTSVQEEFDFKEMLAKGETHIKDILGGVTDGDIISIMISDSLDIENGNHFLFNMKINDKDAAYKTPYEVELPPTSDTYTNFQIYYNVEDDKTYVKVDTTATGNENIVKAYRHSTSYQLMHVPEFKTKTRVNDTRILPSGILKVDPDMDLTVSVQRMERLNEYYTLSDRMIRMDWGRMVSMPGIGNFSAKEFKRSSRSNILLSAGDTYLDVVRFDLVVISADREPTRIRTNNIKSLICKQAFKELDGESSIYFDNIIINDKDEFKYYPYQFVFNVE